jgi:hypothetical protein
MFNENYEKNCRLSNCFAKLTRLLSHLPVTHIPIQPQHALGNIIARARGIIIIARVRGIIIKARVHGITTIARVHGIGFWDCSNSGISIFN